MKWHIFKKVFQLFDQIHRQSINHLNQQTPTFYISIFVFRVAPLKGYRQYLAIQLSNVKSTTSREIVRSVERLVSPSSAKLLSMTKSGKKPICRVSIRASMLAKIYGRGLKLFAIFFPLSSLGYAAAFHGERWKRASTTKEDGEMTRYHGVMYRSSYFHRSKVE